jgi:hypothetical protein
VSKTTDPESQSLNGGRAQIPGANESGEGGAERVVPESTQNRPKSDPVELDSLLLKFFLERWVISACACGVGITRHYI